MLTHKMPAHALVLMLACSGAYACADPSRAPRPKPIDQAQARKLAHQKYREVVGNLYMRMPNSGRYVALPPLEVADFAQVEDLGDAWDVRRDPSAGMIVKVRVSKDGSWTELNEVSFSDE